MAGETERLGLPLRKDQVEQLQTIASMNMYYNSPVEPEPGNRPMACVFPADAFRIGHNTVWADFVQESTMIAAEGLGLDVRKGGIVAKLDEMWLWPQDARPESCKPQVKSVYISLVTPNSSSLSSPSVLPFFFLVCLKPISILFTIIIDLSPAD